jgi:hypothetical protein
LLRQSWADLVSGVSVTFFDDSATEISEEDLGDNGDVVADTTTVHSFGVSASNAKYLTDLNQENSQGTWTSLYVGDSTGADAGVVFCVVKKRIKAMHDMT